MKQHRSLQGLTAAACSQLGLAKQQDKQQQQRSSAEDPPPSAGQQSLLARHMMSSAGLECPGAVLD